MFVKPMTLPWYWHPSDVKAPFQLHFPGNATQRKLMDYGSGKPEFLWFHNTTTHFGQLHIGSSTGTLTRTKMQIHLHCLQVLRDSHFPVFFLGRPFFLLPSAGDHFRACFGILLSFIRKNMTHHQSSPLQDVLQLLSLYHNFYKINLNRHSLLPLNLY